MSPVYNKALSIKNSLIFQLKRIVNKGQEEFEDTKSLNGIRKSKDRQQMLKSFVHKREHFKVRCGTLYIYTCLTVFRPSKNK